MGLNHKVGRVRGCRKATVSLFAGGTVLALASLLIVFGFGHEASAATTYETAAPLSEQLIDFPVVGSGASSTPNYSFVYRLPEGISFDRIQMSVPASQTAYTKTFYVLLGALDSSHTPWDCPTSNCFNGGFSSPTDLTVYTSTLPQSGTVQWVFSTTTTVTTQRDFYIGFDPNSPYVDFSYNGTDSQPNSYALNGSNYSSSPTVPTIKFCNGTCDDNNFSAIPNLTVSAWARLNSPASGSVVDAGTTQNLQFQVNTGTTTADNVQVRFSSNIQSLAPYNYTITQTGLSNFSYDLNLPAIADYIQMVVDVRSGTTSLYVSPTYSLNVRVSGSGLLVNPEEAQSCDDLSGVTWAICTTTAFLFVPSEASINSFFENYERLQGTIPFVYVYDATGMLSGLYSGTATTVPTISVSTGIGTITFISQSQIAAIPYVTLLRSLIAAGLWIMLFVVLYRKTITIHDKDATT